MFEDEKHTLNNSDQMQYNENFKRHINSYDENTLF